MKKILSVCAALTVLLAAMPLQALCAEMPAPDEPPADIVEDPSTPSDPAPEDPAIPEDPENPENPEDPTNPENPENPEDPATPEDPENPEDPANPEDPENPEDPANPEDPENPENPTNPEETPVPDEALEPLEEPEAVIHVVVPQNADIILNPYHMQYNAWYGETTEQVIAQPQAIENYSTVPVRIYASAVGSVPPASSARFVSWTPDPDEKEIFLYAEFKTSLDTPWTGVYTGSENQLLITGEEKEVMTLDAGTEYAPVTGYFNLFGEMSSSPREMWSSAGDSVVINLAFTFEDASGMVG